MVRKKKKKVVQEGGKMKGKMVLRTWKNPVREVALGSSFLEVLPSWFISFFLSFFFFRIPQG